MLIAILVALIPLTALPALAFILMSAGAGLVIASFGMTVVALILLPVMVRQIRRHQDALARVPDTDGHLCPHCLQPVEPTTRVRSCPSCNRRYSTRWLREYWAQILLEPTGHLGTTWSRRNRRRWRWIGGLGLAPRTRRMRVIAGITCLTIALVVTVVRHWFAVDTTWRAAWIVPPFLLVPLGIALLIARREITERWLGCAGCGYRRSKAQHGTHCPECGTTWDGPGTVIRPLRSQRAPVQLLVIIALALFLPTIVSMELFSTNLTPTTVLINRLAMNPFAYNEFSELQRRTLSADDRLALAEALLARREAGDHDQFNLELDSLLRSGTLPASFVARAFDAAYDLRLVTEPGAAGGTDARIELSSLDHLGLAQGCETWTIFSGWQLDDGAPIGATTTPVRATERLSILPRGETVPWAPTLRDVAPGTEIRGTVWLFIGPRPPEGWTIGPDGIPLVPPDVLWSRRFDLSAP